MPYKYVQCTVNILRLAIDYLEETKKSLARAKKVEKAHLNELFKLKTP